MILKGKLNSPYKSFPAGFEFDIQGRLVVLSGVNGSGKTQLLDIVRRYRHPQRPQTIDASITLDETPVAETDCAHRSFAQNIHINPFKNADSLLSKTARDQVWEHYNKRFLNHQDGALAQFQDCSLAAKEILIEEFGADAFKSKRITRMDIDNCPRFDSFVWKTDDIFQNIVSEIFFRFALKKLFAERAAGKTSEKVDYDALGCAPWTELNELFLKFRFGYRFLDDYEIREAGFALNERPKLYAQDPTGRADLEQSRELADLSDGEKAIISLAFGSLSGTDAEPKRILLLDEFDATLNPSLVPAFFGIVERYFVSRGTMVIMATHSLTTISLAPSEASFYEVFSAEHHPNRIIKVDQFGYGELANANQNHLSKISNQAGRIQSLLNQKTTLENLIKGSSEPTVLVEGPTDIILIKDAAEKLNRADVLEGLSIEIIGEETSSGTKNSNNAALKKFESAMKTNLGLLNRRTMILHDPETSVSERDYENKLLIRKMPFVDSNPIKSGVENLFTNATVQRVKAAIPHCFNTRSVKGGPEWVEIAGDSKRNVATWLQSNATKDDYLGFAKLLDLIAAVKD